MFQSMTKDIRIANAGSCDSLHVRLRLKEHACVVPWLFGVVVCFDKALPSDDVTFPFRTLGVFRNRSIATLSVATWL